MRAKKGGNQPHRLGLGQAAVHAQKLELRCFVQAIAGLAFHCGDAQREHLTQETLRSPDQVVLRGAAGCLHRRHNAAAGPGNLQVGSSLDALLKLSGPPAAECQMGVAVD
jgi:hypothetical protein